MKDKILVWLGDALYRFGLAKALKENYECDLFGILDIDKRQKEFLEKQKLVKFTKKWYYRDYVQIDLHKKPDIEYLKNFENKHRINLWNLAYSERYFYKFNEIEFSYDEILSIIEQECKLFDHVIDEIKPDFLVIGTTDLHHNHLLYELCKVKRVNVLMLTGARFGYREMICTDADKIEAIIEPIKTDSKSSKSLEELQDYLQKFNTAKQINEFKKNLQVSTSENIRKFFQKILVYGGKNYRNQFEHYKMTRLKLLHEIISLKLNKRSVKKFVDHNLPREINDDSPFIYYPLHTEPERSLSIEVPFFTNQVEVITNIAKSLPVRYKLYVKDHPGMTFKGGKGRDVSFYMEILDLPNVKLLHPSVSQEELLKKCALVITISGTTGLEAAFFGKPTITFTETLYSHLPFVFTLTKIEELPQAIETTLKKKVDILALNQFVDFIEKNSFQIDRKLLVTDFRRRFLYKEITESEMKSYLDDNKLAFGQLASEHIKKIKQIKARESKINYN